MLDNTPDTKIYDFQTYAKNKKIEEDITKFSESLGSTLSDEMKAEMTQWISEIPIDQLVQMTSKLHSEGLINTGSLQHLLGMKTETDILEYEIPNVNDEIQDWLEAIEYVSRVHGQRGETFFKERYQNMDLLDFKGEIMSRDMSILPVEDTEFYRLITNGSKGSLIFDQLVTKYIGLLKLIRTSVRLSMEFDPSQDELLDPLQITFGANFNVGIKYYEHTIPVGRRKDFSSVLPALLEIGIVKMHQLIADRIEKNK